MDTATALAAVAVGADALGFVFAASRRRITPEAARDIIRQLPPFVTRVGVFVNTPPGEVMEIAAYCGLTVIQLSVDGDGLLNGDINEGVYAIGNGNGNGNGNESEHDYANNTHVTSAEPGTAQLTGAAPSGCPLECCRCSRYAGETVHTQSGNTVHTRSGGTAPAGQPLYSTLPVIKTLRVGRGRPLPMWPGCRAAAYLFDTYQKGLPGGTGETFDWRILQNTNCPKPVILAGGLTVANVRDAIKLVKPYAVDVSGGVETDGRKDVHKIKEFILQAKGVLM
jgi:phosphoribosylanthranilate isomerase